MAILAAHQLSSRYNSRSILFDRGRLNCVTSDKLYTMANSEFPRSTWIFLALLVIAGAGCNSTDMEADKADSGEAIARIVEELKIVNLLRDSLALAPDVEVIVSYLELPDSTALPTHYHPGEEFVYMLEGKGVLTIEGEEFTLEAGDFQKIPLKAVHKFVTSDLQGRGVVFRVHEKGQPDRILVDQD